MGLLDAILGRSKQAAPNLDRLFGLPSAAVTLLADGGLTPTGQAAVCFKPASGTAFAELETEAERLLSADDGDKASWSQSQDEFGYHWIVLRAGSLEDLVTRVHMVNSSLESAGFGPQLLCSVFAFADEQLQRCYLVYLYKRGTFYPFAPRGDQRRDNELELRLRAVLGVELSVEPDLTRWFPMWGLPLG